MKTEPAQDASSPSAIEAFHVETKVDLSQFDNSQFCRGRSAVTEALWIILQTLFVRSFFPGSGIRIALLRLFGAQIGRRVTIKPGVRVKFPWRLRVADQVWIGEGVWIDNLADVTLRMNSCLSQGAYLCTGSHDWSSGAFDLITRPIVIGESAWIAAKATVGPGVTVGEGAVLTLGGVAISNLEPWVVYSGVPAQPVRARGLRAAVPSQVQDRVR